MKITQARFKSDNVDLLNNKTVLLRENARGVPIAAYPVHGLSCWGVPQSLGGVGGYPSPSEWGTPAPGGGG